MKAKEAIARAKALLSEFYVDEVLAGVRLEEVEFDEINDSWLITLGILRPPVETETSFVAQLTGQQQALARTYKVLTIPNSSVKEPSMRIRELLGEA